ncbi:Trans-aconitate 2-methyltransferase [Carbonactinospora thermoautotrophica]|uniref:Trans-aconitate 2-methyltransferase n=1 Tax=Carbonactinospora thermoautotrophica TaxID=1469144 RepID=A0A132MMY8_9ACTN|nr:trans-aconitate 2-methyltransferase [Carbonactinospora thermoautotrophica]KWW99095.1 Trans-aconitate 2-methyltransferase [Carbonactinospora thermoautotrophica]
MWDPQQYLKYRDERARPFHDLLARVQAEHAEYVVDLGCGPGNLTATLAERWPAARVLGIDSSPQMIEAAQRHAVPGRIEFRVQDLRGWQPARAPDVVVANAVFQWVPGHLDLLPRLVRAVRPGGWLAFQVPANFTAPSHEILRAIAARRALAIDWPNSHEPQEYLDALARLGCAVDVWETTYHHVLPGDDAVLEWVKGTGARPVLEALAEAERAEFLAEYGAALRQAYPKQPYGTVLSFRRVFAVAQTPGGRP